MARGRQGRDHSGCVYTSSIIKCCTLTRESNRSSSSTRSTYSTLNRTLEMIWFLWSLWPVMARIRGTMFHSLMDCLWTILITFSLSALNRRRHGARDTNTVRNPKLPFVRRCLTRAQVPRRGCQHYSGCYERPDTHGRANDTAVPLNLISCAQILAWY